MDDISNVIIAEESVDMRETGGVSSTFQRSLRRLNDENSACFRDSDICFDSDHKAFAGAER